VPDRARILVVEDESDMARILEFNLSQQGHCASVAPEGRVALERFEEWRPDLVLLDLRLPDMSGLDVLRAFKEDQRSAGAPVIIVSALGDEDTVVEGLNLGADDYVTKPFRVHELMARVSGALRRAQAGTPSAPLLRLGEIVVDVEAREVRVGECQVDFTRSEFDLLAHLVRHAGRAFTRHQLCHQALGAGDSVQERTVDAHIRTIRRKLGEAGRRLTTVWGVGYKVVE